MIATSATPGPGEQRYGDEQQPDKMQYMVPILGALLRAGIGSVLFGRMVSTNQFP